MDKIDPLLGSHGTPGFEAELDDDHMLVNAGAPRQTLPSFAAVRDESTEAALRRKQLERERAIEDYWAEMFREQNRLAVSNKQKGNKLAASLYAGNFGTGSGNKTYNDMGALAASDMMIKNVSMTIPESEVYQGNRPNKSQSTRDNSQFASLKHNMPISGGISVAYPITPRISILSGVNYTYMYSSSKHSIDNMATGVKSLEQHYIGIPLGISYSVYSGRVLDFYVRGGGMIEKGIYAGIKEGVMTNDGSSDEVKSSEKIKGIQPSIDAGIGANIRIAKSVGLYIEPGVAYYFERPDQLASYRTENPTNFTLRVGVRFNLK